MTINLLFFKEKLKEYEPVIFGNAPNYPLSSVELLDSGPYSHNTLYISNSFRNLEKVDPHAEISVVLTGQPEFGENQLENFIKEHRINIILLKSFGNKNIVEQIKNYYDYYQRLSSFSYTLTDILCSEGNLQNIVDVAYEYIENPICIFDAGFQIIAANRNILLKNHDTIHQLVLEKRCMDQQDIENLNFEHIHECVRKNKKPVLIKSKYFGADIIAAMINNTKNMGHVTVKALNQPFRDIDYDYMEILRQVVDQQLKKNEFVFNSKGFIYEYFLRDLLDGKIRDNKHFLDRISYVDREFIPFMYCLVVETTRTGAMSLYQLQRAFESLLPNASILVYNEQIVILLTGRKELELHKEENNKLQNFFFKHSLYCGISNSFSCILELAQHYRQALHAIESGVCTSDRPGIFVYKHYFMNHIFNIFRQKENPEIFCNVQLRFLIDYDKKHNKELARTLYTYLLYERNMALAAERMFIHRNTFAYRIGKISDLVYLNLDDPDVRRYILLSFELIARSDELNADNSAKTTNMK